MSEKFRIVSSDYKTSATAPEQFLSDLPEVAFVGRSNVGKSSLINSLTSTKRLAKTSSTPGLTKMVNYFIINNNFYFVDLPGYGFSKTGKTHREMWSSLIEQYLLSSRQLKLVFLLLDLRRVPSELDFKMQEFLYLYNIPFKIIATKSDKIAKSKIKTSCLELAKNLSIGVDDIIPYSVENTVSPYNSSVDLNFGKEKILELIKLHCKF